VKATASGSVSAHEPDWSRERCGLADWNPPRRLLRTIRRYQSWRGRLGFLGAAIRKLSVLEHRFWSAVCGADIPINCSIGGGLLMPHPNGIVIHPEALIGPNCLIFQQVTIGMGGPIPGLPRIGGHVDIGAGAKILGGIVIGDHARIGANAVVFRDVPAGRTAVGIPAQLTTDGRSAPVGAVSS
jgi:serine O-acetyltransferase